MHGGHQTFFDSESFFEKNVHDWGQAVGRAACVADDCKEPLDRTCHDSHPSQRSDVFAVLGRSRDDNLLGTGGDVTFGFFSFGERPVDSITISTLICFQGSSAAISR